MHPQRAEAFGLDFVILFRLLFVIWKMRNTLIFEGVLSIACVVKMFEFLVGDFNSALLSDRKVQMPRLNTFVWIPSY